MLRIHHHVLHASVRIARHACDFSSIFHQPASHDIYEALRDEASPSTTFILEPLLQRTDAMA
jgi:hypothetical protein